MASLLDMVQQHLGQNEIDQISRQVGADPATTQSAITAALPMILGGMASTAQQPQGADAIHNSLASHGGLLGNLGGLLGGGGLADGGGLLGNILGQHQQPVQQGVSQASGLDPDQSRKLIMILAPIVMAVLARKHAQAQQQGTPQPVGQVLQTEAQHAQQQAQQQRPQLGGLLGQILGGFGGGRAG